MAWARRKFQQQFFDRIAQVGSRAALLRLGLVASCGQQAAFNSTCLLQQRLGLRVG